MTEVTVTELKLAWQAIKSGKFSTAIPATSMGAELPEWLSSERVLPVLGVHGNCGASTMALALATQSAPSRVAECASGPECGLVGASTKELGPAGTGWLRGTRGEVVIDRGNEIWLNASEVPPLADLVQTTNRTIVDIGWDPTHVLSSSSWLASILLSASSIVLVAEVSIPSLRRLENTLGLFTQPVSLAAVIGPPLKRWPRLVLGSLGQRTRELLETQRLVSVPLVDALHVSGVTPEPLPQPVLAAAEEILLIADLPLLTPATEKDI